MGEEIAATPGWVGAELDEVFGALPKGASFDDARSAYADCLADCKARTDHAGSGDAQTPQERCHRQLISRLTELGLSAASVQEVSARLEAIEDEITERT